MKDAQIVNVLDIAFLEVECEAETISSKVECVESLSL